MTPIEIESIVVRAVSETLRTKFASSIGEDFCHRIEVVADLLALHSDTIHDMIKDGRLGSVGRGKLLRVRDSDIARYYAQHSTCTTPIKGDSHARS
jgi:excisionase family DNA binding protein